MAKRRAKTTESFKAKGVTQKKTTWNKTTNYVRKNHLSLLGLLITSLVAIGIAYWTITGPDLRIFSKQPKSSKILEYKIDEQGNYVYHLSCRIKFKNLSIKSGFVEKVEIAPLTISTIPESKIISIEKTPIGWREEKEVEIRYLIIIPHTVIENLTHSQKVSLEVLLNMFDNEGKLINKFEGGPYKYARIKQDLEQPIKVELMKPRLK